MRVRSKWCVIAAAGLLAAIAWKSAAQNLPEDKDLPDWIVDKPVKFDELRIELTKQYAVLHYGSEDISIVPKIIVIHWTGGHSVKSAFNNFNKSKLAGRPFLQKYGKVNVAAHYLVGRKGTVYKLMPDTLMGRHVIGLNHCSIGVENVGNNDLTKKQLKANAGLVAYLAKKHDTIKYLIGHYEYLKFEGSTLFIEKYPEYRTKKKDPGKKFMKKLRGLLKKEGVELESEPIKLQLL